MAAQEWFGKDFYATLGVSKDADADAIKKAYRKLARANHPDQNPGDAGAEERFKNINEAYQVLSDAKSRKQYDTMRAMGGAGARFAGAGSPFSGAAGSFDANDIFSMFAGGQGGEDILHNLFNMGKKASAGGFGASGGSPFSGGASFSSGSFGADAFAGGGFPQRPMRGADLQTSTTLTLRQAVEGATLKLTVEGRSVTVKVPAGVNDGQTIRLRGRGRPGHNGGEAGNLLVTVKIAKHPVFQLDGDDLRMRLPITYSEALLGAKVEVPLLDGSHVTVKIPAGTTSGTQLRVRKRGVTAGRKKGDLLIEVTIAVPDRVSAEMKRAAEALNAAQGEWNPRADLAANARG